MSLKAFRQRYALRRRAHFYGFPRLLISQHKPGLRPGECSNMSDSGNLIKRLDRRGHAALGSHHAPSAPPTWPDRPEACLCTLPYHQHRSPLDCPTAKSTTLSVRATRKSTRRAIASAGTPLPHEEELASCGRYAGRSVLPPASPLLPGYVWEAAYLRLI